MIKANALAEGFKSLIGSRGKDSASGRRLLGGRVGQLADSTGWGLPKIVC